jgi:hypothetical protein
MWVRSCREEEECDDYVLGTWGTWVRCRGCMRCIDELTGKTR